MKDVKTINDNDNLNSKTFIPVEIKDNQTKNKPNKISYIYTFLIILIFISLSFNLFFYFKYKGTFPKSLANNNIVHQSEQRKEINKNDNEIYERSKETKKNDNKVHEQSKEEYLKNNDNDFLSELNSIIDKQNILLNEKMSKHTTFRIGGFAKYFVKPKTIDEIVSLINLCKKYNIQFFVLGNGSNLLVSDDGFDGVIIFIHEENFSNLELTQKTENDYSLQVGGGMLMKTLAIRACLLGLTGLEDIIDIPGTVGGGIIMNASFIGGGIVVSLAKVKVITPEGTILELTKNECKFRHRGSMLKDEKYLVIEASFNLKKGDKMIIQKTLTDNTMRRYSKQPMYFGSAGCFFVWNHREHGGQYEKYKQLGIVGYKIGDAMIYTHNIAFIVNLGNAKSKDVYEIVKYIEKLMKDKYNITIQREVIVLGPFI
jgi:UDP-N-acetylmuramate dehydrogenase